MDLPEAWSQWCICGRDFTTPQGYSLHHNSCSKSKKWLEAVLGQAREVQAIKKCHRAEAKLPAELPSNDLPLPGTHQQVGFLIRESPSLLMFICVCQAGKASVDYEDLDQSLAECRTRHGHHWLLKCYQDIAPEAPAALPPTLQIIMASTQAELNVPHSLSLSPSLAPASPVRKTFKSSRNMFGLFRQYYTTGFPDHDPGEHIQLNNLHTSTSLVRDYSPYPTRVVLGLMFSSDGTQLMSFSTAKLWPVYLLIGNESKDRRSKLSCQAFEHVAYLETASKTSDADVI